MKLDEFTQAYVECALWSSTEDSGEPLDELYDIDDIHPDTLARIIEDCRQFQIDHRNDIADNIVRAGHDFWLTRNHHGAGFWDGDWPDAIGQRLTNAAHVWDDYDLYTGDDGCVHGT